MQKDSRLYSLNEFDLGIEKYEAYEVIQDAFDSDPQLRIRFANQVQGDLSVNYTNNSQYREGEYMDLSIYKIPIGNEIMVIQDYPIDKWKKERPLGLFLKEVSKLDEGIELPRNWHEVDSDKWNSNNLINRVPGGEVRVNGVLHDVERYERIFLLYQKFFSGDPSILGIPKERLNIPQVASEIIEDQMRALDMTRIMINKPENTRFFNYGTKGLFGYDSDSYIACAVEIE
ncbi:MAG: hypothetical protein XD93_0179 [candidate division WS6 bacterium 34_10]|jgi:hypothetical protein|uniref:Uncharacterized protein n=1 Tax=candidate division WS6 bacterium 34_10 TaxID=1641389 RepID=A0A117M0I9_9BACT|nr:MAG: hypothetical protein XD93_0179 [candidate division WS6 bacterium 34_10]